MDLEKFNSDIQSIEEVENAEVSDVGISVKFKSAVDTYLDAVTILKDNLNEDDEDEVRYYSNMTGEGDEHIIILVEV